jgi:hypothetical protein
MQRARSSRPFLVSRLLVAIGALLVGTSCAREVVAEARPVISLASNSYDFGTVAQGTKVTHEFEVRNTGTADLVIQRLSPSCGCTATQLASPIIKPGGSEKVRVTFDTSGFMGDKTKSVVIASNDASNPELVVTIKGQVLSSFTVEPARVDFGEVLPSSPLAARQKQVTFSVAEGSDLTISKVTSLSKHLVVSPVSAQGNRATVTIEILPTVPLGEFRDRVVFERIQFENKGRDPVSIQSITTSNAAISASMVNVQPGRLGVLVVKVDPRRVSGDLKETVELKTSHPTQSSLSVNVFGVLPPK